MSLGHNFVFEYKVPSIVLIDCGSFTHFERYVCNICGIYKGVYTNETPSSFNYKDVGKTHTIFYDYSYNVDSISCGEYLVKNIL